MSKGNGKIPTFWMSGDLGDIIASLPFIRQKGGGDIVISNHPRMDVLKSRPMKGRAFEIIKPLLESQFYVNSVRYDENPKKVDYNFMEWREAYLRIRSLAHSQAAYFGLGPLDVLPWIQVEPDERSKGKVVICRTERYQNNSFPWGMVLEHYKGRCIFVGLPEEHQALEKRTLKKVEYFPTKDLLEVARIIAGSELYISNQTCSMWIAMALGHPLIQETYHRHADSVIPNYNAQFVVDGKVKFPSI